MKTKLNYLSLAVAAALTGLIAQGYSGEVMAAEKKAKDEKFRDLNGNGKMEPYEDPNLAIEKRVDDVLSRMTQEQKINLVVGTGMSGDDYMNRDRKVPGAAGYTYDFEDLGIPPIVLADGPAGVRILPQREGDENTYFATAFPIGTLLASSWDVTTLETVGEAMGNEVKEYGNDMLLAPGMNIHRNPLGGRNFEYYSEDPYLTGKIAAAMVDGLEADGTGATIKHYVANNQETNRFSVDTIVSERALREIYLRGFEIAVKASQPWAVMSSYNLLDGTYTAQREDILTTVLRDEWGFKGFVMTDWWGGDDAVAQMQAGNDMIMPGEETDKQKISAAISSGKLEKAALERNARNILLAIFRSPSFAGYQYSDKPDLESHAKTARMAAADGAILLKNKAGTLPLGKDMQKIAVFGNTSYDFISGGTGSGDVNEAYTISLNQGLESAGYQVDAKLASSYEKFITDEKARQPKKEYFFQLLPPIPEMPFKERELDKLARQSDVALLTIGRIAGEFQDRKVKDDFDLTDSEQQLIADVSKAFHAQGKQVVVILNIGNVVEIASWRDQVDAILLPWQGGQEAGNAIADILTGKVNPSGRLATTFPVSYTDVPSSNNFPGVELSDEIVTGVGGFAKGKHARVEYEEGIYVGYRYYDRFNVKPAYEFGYGLSYTDFKFSPAQLDNKSFKDSLTVKVTVTNSGKVAGKEVVQLYLGQPDVDMDKPVKELKGFAKTRLLAPGESQELSFMLNPKDLASFDDARSAWVAEAGTYRVSVGASSRDIRAMRSFRLDKELVVEKVLTDLTPKRKLEDLKP